MREISTIKDELRNSPYAHQFVFESEEATRLSNLSEILNRVQPDIVHFSGHASKAGILLEDNAGNAQPVSEDALKEIFHLLRGNIRCVVLNACYTEQQAIAIAEDIPCVVTGMLNQIDDESAIAFASEFYRQLARGADVSMAFRLGRTQIKQGKELARLLAFKVNPSRIVFVKQNAWIKYGILTTLVVVLLAAALWFISSLLPQPTSRINPKDNASYVWIPPGAFTMGSSITDTSASTTERPQHMVILDGFWLMQTEVTNDQYKRCVDANVCLPPNDTRWSDLAYAQHPVVNITWEDANTYANVSSM